jgi:tetratricopeptide (TPR) repeat protein
VRWGRDLGRRIAGPWCLGLGIALGALAPPAAAHEGLHEQIEAVSRQIARDPTNAALLLKRGELHRLHRDWARALADYDRAARLAPGLSEVEFARGRMLFEAGRYREARAVLDRFLAREPDQVSALLARARTLAALGDALGAAGDYTEALARMTPPEPDVYVERARTLASLGGRHAESALAGLDEGIARLGPLVTLELCAVDVELGLGRYDAALGRIDRAAAGSARKETWLARRGEILERAGRPAEARAAYAEALDAIRLLPPYRRTRAVVALEAHVRDRIAAGERAP